MKRILIAMLLLTACTKEVPVKEDIRYRNVQAQPRLDDTIEVELSIEEYAAPVGNGRFLFRYKLSDALVTEAKVTVQWVADGKTYTEVTTIESGFKEYTYMSTTPAPPAFTVQSYRVLEVKTAYKYVFVWK